MQSRPKCCYRDFGDTILNSLSSAFASVANATTDGFLNPFDQQFASEELTSSRPHHTIAEKQR